MGSSTSVYECIIIGGGASGLYCASLLADKGVKDVLVLDSNSRLGKKLMLTGSGRCNITNTSISMSNYYSDDLDRTTEIIHSYTSNDVIDYFQNKLGVNVCYKGDLVYPVTLSSSTVVDALRYHINENGIEVLNDSTCVRISKNNDSYECFLNNNESVLGKRIVFATGGITYSQTGCSSLGMGLVSHIDSTVKIAPLIPALVSIVSSDKDIKVLSGSKINCKVNLLDSNDSLVKSSRGELLFTDRGISGICVMDISGYAISMILQGAKKVCVSLELSDLNEDELTDAIVKRKIMFPNRDVVSALEGIYRRTLLEVILKRCSIKVNAIKDLTSDDISKLVSVIKNFKISISGSGDADKGQVTRGGIMLSCVDDNLMLKNADNVYVIGEMLNVDGICGGYNLQWAWSSAAVAANAIGKDVSDV